MEEAEPNQGQLQIQDTAQPESEAAAQQQVLQTLDDIQQISENLVVLLAHQQEKIDTIAANIENSAATTVEGVKQVHKVGGEILLKKAHSTYHAQAEKQANGWLYWTLAPVGGVIGLIGGPVGAAVGAGAGIAVRLLGMIIMKSHDHSQIAGAISTAVSRKVDNFEKGADAVKSSKKK